MHMMQEGFILFLGFLLICSVTTARADDIAQGRVMYDQYCAACHGMSGEGDGYLARALTIPPTNLRLLSARYGNPLPADQIARFIDGRADVKAHGPRHMPVFGAWFYAQTGRSKRQTKNRIAKLVAYLQSIQTIARSDSRKQ